MKSEEKRELIAPQKSKPKPKATAKPKSTPRRSVQSVPTGLKAPANQNAGEMALNPVSKLSSQSENNYITRQQQVINLAQQGLEVAEIARQLKMGQGEIQLILGLKKNMKERTEK
jgi:DNA-binding NarL/FixJ family response regulator